MIKRRLILQNKAETESILRDWFSSNGVFIKKIESGNSKIIIFIAEEYYYRIKSNLTLTVIVEETSDKTTVDVISSGGKTSMGFSYGAEKSAMKDIVQLLKEKGFAEL